MYSDVVTLSVGTSELHLNKARKNGRSLTLTRTSVLKKYTKPRAGGETPSGERGNGERLGGAREGETGRGGENIGDTPQSAK